MFVAERPGAHKNRKDDDEGDAMQWLRERDDVREPERKTKTSKDVQIKQESLLGSLSLVVLPAWMLVRRLRFRYMNSSNFVIIKARRESRVYLAAIWRVVVR